MVFWPRPCIYRALIRSFHLLDHYRAHSFGSHWSHFTSPAVDLFQTMEPFEKMREAIAAIPPAQFEVLQRTFAGLGEELKLAIERDKIRGPAFKLFAKLGLTGLERHMGWREIEHALKISKTKGNRAVQEYIFRIFLTKEYRFLNQMVRVWWNVPDMRKRKKTIRAAIAAHRAGKYDLAIPTLLPLIDGLAAQIMPNSSTHNPIVAKKVATQFKLDEGEEYSECVERVVHALIYKKFDFNTAKRPPSSVNRHAILHGRVVGYGSELNSYRVILLLDVMVDIAG
jgi:hypothetical protein